MFDDLLNSAFVSALAGALVAGVFALLLAVVTFFVERRVPIKDRTEDRKLREAERTDGLAQRAQERADSVAARAQERHDSRVSARIDIVAEQLGAMRGHLYAAVDRPAAEALGRVWSLRVQALSAEFDALSARRSVLEWGRRIESAFLLFAENGVTDPDFGRTRLQAAHEFADLSSISLEQLFFWIRGRASDEELLLDGAEAKEMFSPWKD